MNSRFFRFVAICLFTVSFQVARASGNCSSEAQETGKSSASQTTLGPNSKSSWISALQPVVKKVTDAQKTAEGQKQASLDAGALAGNKAGVSSQDIAAGSANASKVRFDQASDHAATARTQASACLTTVEAALKEGDAFKKKTSACALYRKTADSDETLGKPDKELENTLKTLQGYQAECTRLQAAATSMTSTFLKNAAIVGGIGAVAAGAGFGIAAAIGGGGDKPDSNKAAKAACEKTDGMQWVDGTCKSKTALAACPDGFVKDKDGYCVMKDTNGTAIDTSVAATPATADKNIKVATPNTGKADALSAKDKALAGLAASEGGAAGGGAAGAGAAGGAAGAGGGSGKGGAAGGGAGASGGSGGAYGGRGGAGGEGAEAASAEGGAREAVDEPLKWKNSSARDRDLPISRRRRLSNGSLTGTQQK